MPEAKFDLRQLALDRSPKKSAAIQPHRQRWLIRYVLPIGILLGFAALLAVAAGRQLLPQKSVTVVPVMVKRAQVQQIGTPLFQAAGWIEPRPTAVNVTALASGVIEELLVVEGQQVKKGQPIARLIAIDAELTVQQANATLAIREAELQRAKAKYDAAVIRLENPVHLTVQQADANSMLARARTELDKIPFLIEVAKANADFHHKSLQGKQAAKSAIAGVIVDKVAKDHATSLAELNELRKRQPNLKREVEALQGKVDALQQQLVLRVEENRQLQEARANLASVTAIRDEAKLRLRKAELNLERTVVRATIHGRILRLIASQGSRVMGLESNASHSSSTVVEMYDPLRLQVRADVRLEDVPLVTPGAAVEIETAASGSVIQGRVLQTTSSANIQKNTLEVKVELLGAPANVSPEMLVTATFLAPELNANVSENTTERVFVPQQLVQSDDDRTFVWIVGINSRAERVQVVVGKTSRDGLVEVIQGLDVTDKLIASGRDDLQQGDAIVVRGEDLTIGI